MMSVPVPCEINVLITNDNGIQSINKATRDLDKPTDVLSFPMFQFKAGKLPDEWSEYLDPETGLCPLGDMAISLERTISQAKEFGHSDKREIGYLTIHSVLHLLGYDHIDEGEQKRQMRDQEERIAACIPGLNRN
jgi:probable rRNA maturation factor